MRIRGALLFFCGLLLLSGCKSDEQQIEGNPDSFNFRNGGLVAQLEHDMFYIDGLTGIVYRKNETEQAIPISDKVSSGMLPYENSIYFSNLNDDRTLYMMNRDGENLKKISDLRCDALVPIGDKIYFTNEDSDKAEDNLYVMDLDGRNIETVYKGTVRYLYPCDNVLYFVNKVENGYQIVTLQGSEVLSSRAIDCDTLYSFFVLDGYMYFATFSSFYRISMESQDTELIEQDATVSAINLCGNQIIYCRSTAERVDVYSFNAITSNKKHIRNGFYPAIYVANNAIYLWKDNQLIKV